MFRTLRLGLIALALSTLAVLNLLGAGIDPDGFKLAGDHGAGIDPDGGKAPGSSSDNSDTRGTIDPNGLKLAADNEHGATIDPNGRA